MSVTYYQHQGRERGLMESGYHKHGAITPFQSHMNLFKKNFKDIIYIIYSKKSEIM
jgi:hypothetical protein